MAPENPPETLPSRPLALLEVGVSAFIALAAAGLSISMPRLVAVGGIREAQDFIRLTPVFFPQLAFGVLALLGCILLARALRQLPLAPPSGGENWVDRYRNTLAVAALVVLYSFLFPWLGFSVAGFAGIAALTILLGSRKWWEIIPVSLLAPLAVRFVFERLLLISLPRSAFDAIARPEEALMQFLVHLFFRG